MNLLLNSTAAFHKHTSTDAPEIRIACSEEEDQVHIVFRDNGHGISKEDLKQVADPFFSLDKGDEKMGLGLSICQTIMRHHGGTMEITSQQGAWTEIILTFNNTPITTTVGEQGHRANISEALSGQSSS